MRLSLLTMMYAASVFLCAQAYPEAIDDSQKLKRLFCRDFLESKDNELFDLAVCRTLSESENELMPSELKEEFELAMNAPEIEQRFLSIYASELNEEELDEAIALFEDERYVKLRKKIAQANFKCYQESLEVLKDLSASTRVILPPKKNRHPILRIKEDNLDEILNSSRFVIVDAYADWCGPCKYLDVVIKELNQKFGGTYRFAKLNVDKERKLSRLWDITSLPTVLFFKEGQEVGRERGFMNMETFLGVIEEYFQEEIPSKENELKEISPKVNELKEIADKEREPEELIDQVHVFEELPVQESEPEELPNQKIALEEKPEVESAPNDKK